MAGRADSAQAIEALERLCRSYWRPLFRYARRLRWAQHDAEDVTQAFFAHFLEKGYIRAADPQRGRFRTFLLTSFRHFLEREWQKTRAVKRGGGGHFIPVSELQSDDLIENQLSSNSDPVHSYDTEWAANLYALAMRQLKDEHASAGLRDQFNFLKRFLAEPGDATQYADAGKQVAMSPNAVAVAVHRLRRRYGELLRAEVARTLCRSDDMEDELKHLRNCLAAPES